ncbi:hypothetical protein OnM2_004031 [Erysiphe neolycopersici]|uniref:Uncharacterized protein n=1 Tax=Erysiphe neolycopersici TaxID=212602 RepID=A0A420I7T3_9PEZI|nr:hypothetical protein OnM2_004031 [Erysiphe neolycopersici]
MARDCELTGGTRVSNDDSRCKKFTPRGSGEKSDALYAPLDDVDANTFIRNYFIEIVDIKAGEEPTKIQNLIILLSNKHRLVLLLKDKKPSRYGKMPVKLKQKLTVVRVVPKYVLRYLILVIQNHNFL